MPTGVWIGIIAAAVILTALITAAITSGRMKNRADGVMGNAEKRAREIIDEALKTAEDRIEK